MHPLDGAQLKFDWASKHVDCLDKEIHGLVNKDTHGVLDKYDPQLGEYVRYIQGERSPPRWSLLIGDIAHNFRSCLDHIAWQLAVAASPTDKPQDYWKDVRQISFPIFDDRHKYRSKPDRNPKRDAVWRLDGLLPHHARQVRRCQPYLRRHAPQSHPLWHLHELSNIDKHQVLHTTVIDLRGDVPAVGEMSKKIIDPVTGEFEMIYDWPQGLRPPGARLEVVMRVGGSSEGEVHLKGDLPFEVEIDQPGTILHEQPVLRLMDGIRSEVEGALAAFWPLL